jgi:hypothetical protein
MHYIALVLALIAAVASAPRPGVSSSFAAILQPPSSLLIFPEASTFAAARGKPPEK